MTRTLLLGGSDLVPRRGRLVVTPNENAADTMGVEHRSLEDHARRVLGEGRVAHPVLVRRLLRDAVVDGFGGEDASGTARSLLPTIRALFRAGASLEDERGSRRARRVFDVARDYRRRLRERALVDPAETLREAAKLSPPPRPLLLWGYPRLGRDEIEYVDAVAGEGSTVLLPRGDDAAFDENLETARELARRGWSVTEEAVPALWEPGVPVEARSYPHLEAEVRGVLAEAKGLLARGVPPDDVVLVARDDASYGPTVLAVAREYGVPVRALYRLPLSQTRVGSWFRSLLEANEQSFPFEVTARLLAHPLGPGLDDEAWGEARRFGARGTRAWARCGVDLSPLNLSRKWPHEASRAGWVERLRALLDDLGVRCKARPWTREVVALSRLDDALEWLGSDGPSPAAERISQDHFLDELRKVLDATTSPAHPAVRGVALHTPLSLYGARYRHAFVLGLAEGSFPPPIADDPTLDFHERGRLRAEGVSLELAGERALRERLSFWTLLQVPRERLILSYPKASGGRGRLPSPYFTLLGCEPVAAGPQPAASLEEARRAFLRRDGFDDGVLQRAVRAWEVELGREGAAPFDAHDGVLGTSLHPDERVFSASQLGELARCGFKWWANRVLRLSEPEEGESPALLGSLYHRVIEVATARAEGTHPEGLRVAILGHLEESFAQAERELGLDRMRAWPARRQPLIEMLRRAIEAEEFAVPGAEVAETESSFDGEWRGFRVVGRVDRVDRTPEGLVFVDYKSGSSVPSPDLQLALYREAAAAALFPGEAVRDAYYYSMKKNERINAKPPDEDEVARVVGEVRANLEAGRLPPDALERDPAQEVCKWCAFDLVCRNGPRLARKTRGEGAP